MTLMQRTRRLTSPPFLRSVASKLRRNPPVSVFLCYAHNHVSVIVGPSALEAMAAPSTSAAAAPPPPTAAETQSAYVEQLADVPELAEYGPVLNSSATAVPLTESETEYQVTCVKHIFKEHIVFQVRTQTCFSESRLMDVTSLMYQILSPTPCWRTSASSCSRQKMRA